MKRRTFFATLSLFLLFIFLGITVISIISLQNMMRREKNRAMDEHYFITSSLTKDFAAVSARDGELERNIVSLVSPYSRLSKDQKTELSFYDDESRVFSSGFGIPISSEYSLRDGFRHLEIQKIEEKYCIIVDGRFPYPYESYRLLYQYNLTSELMEWWNMVGMLFLVGGILSIVLSVLLLLLIEKLFRPLQKLSDASKSVSSGKYDIRLPLGGGEELDDLSTSFNRMAEKIGEQIKTLEEAVDSRQGFVDNFSHEMRTPLTAIYGYAEYLQITEASAEETFSALSSIMLQSGRLQAMAVQLLELAGLRGGKVEWRKIGLSDLFQQATQSLDSKLLKKRIKLIVINSAEYIYGDTHLLLSLFINLLDNAVSASYEESEIKLTAHTKNEEVIITLEDFGKGIEEDHLLHITEPFYRGDKARNRSEGGTGLGLSICAEIVKRHNANISFSSTIAKGTTVLLTFTTSLLPDDKMKTSTPYPLWY